MPAGRGDVAMSRDSTRRWEDVKCLVDIWPVFTTICARRTQKQKNSDADKIRKIQMRAPSAPSNTGGTRPFVSLSFFFWQTILRRLLPGSTYEICFALVVFCRKQTAAEFECHRTQTTFSTANLDSVAAFRIAAARLLCPERPDKLTRRETPPLFENNASNRFRSERILSC